MHFYIFTQSAKKPTTNQGSLIDHIYTRNISVQLHVEVYHLKNIITLYQLSIRCLSGNRSSLSLEQPKNVHFSTQVLARLTALAGYI